MRPRIPALVLALLISLVAAAPASAGQIVFNSGDEIRVANDDGSGQPTYSTSPVHVGNDRRAAWR